MSGAGRRGGEGAGGLAADARRLLAAAIDAVDPERLVADALADEAALPPGGRPVHLVAVGKAAAGMAAGAVRRLGERRGDRLAIVPPGLEEALPQGFRAWAGGHPVPNAAGVEGARAVLELARRLGADDLLLCLVSGGGSALMTLPPDGVSLAEVQATTELLLRAGATIGELNAVRKHLDQLKGGRLARAAAPGRALGLVLSDVVGDPLDVIASGPLSPDPTTYADAEAVLERRGVADRVPAAVRRHLERGRRGELAESPAPGDPCFARAEARVVGSNRLAVAAMERRAAELGYRPLVLTTVLTGEARHAGAALAAVALEARASGRPVAPPACLLAAGETTVTVTGGGRGGRNQELALAAALRLAEAGDDGGIVAASAGTDGIDGPTDAAGAVTSARTVAAARERGLDPAAALADNDVHPLLEALGALVVTGPTGTNVMDVQVLLVAPAARP